MTMDDMDIQWKQPDPEPLEWAGLQRERFEECLRGLRVPAQDLKARSASHETASLMSRVWLQRLWTGRN